MNDTKRSGDAVPLPVPKELMKKIEELEAGHSYLKEEMSKLMISRNDDKSQRNRSRSVSPQRPGQQRAAGGSGGDFGGIGGPVAVNFKDNQYLNILQSMGQSVHASDVNCRIIYWNTGAEYLYGWTPSEALGKDALKLLIFDKDFILASDIIHRISIGESWTGKFPVKNKRGERFTAFVTDTPFYDDNKMLIGIMCISVDIRPFRESKATYSRITHSEIDAGFGRTNMFPSSSRLGLDFPQPLQAAATKISNLASRVTNKVKLKMRAGENIMDEGGSGDSHHSDVDGDSYCEISWDELKIGQPIGEGSCGNVFHAMWNESDVAVKVFSKQEYSDDVILSFKQEVALMKRLRHPNILLFMGAVTAAERLCIVMEFLPRGSLFKLIRKNLGKLDLRRKTQMALDIARGMNYLHFCHPPIIHRDLKSSNLLVDKNWRVKVGDFGLSRIKHEAYLTTKSVHGTPQWMAPEVLKNEPSDEKSDVYSFGVVLWEIVTEKIPWDGLQPLQVIAAVGCMNERLDIPTDIDPQWALLIESCWHSDTKRRPSFQEILERLRDMNRSLVVPPIAPR